MNIHCIIAARGGSKGILNKNITNFCGKPLFQWVLDSLLAVERIDKIIINTDAREILKDFHILNNDKVIIRDRPDDICGDFVSMNVVIKDDIDNVDADIYLMTHTTNPLLSKKSVECSISQFKDALKDRTANSLFTVNKAQERFYDSNAKALNHDPENLVRTQDLEPWYQENSNLYLFTKEGFSQTNARIGSKPMMLETPPYESTDIDTPDDWDLAEVMVEYYRKKGVIQ